VSFLPLAFFSPLQPWSHANCVMIPRHPAIASFEHHGGYAPALAPVAAVGESLAEPSLDPAGSWPLVEASLCVGSTWLG